MFQWRDCITCWGGSNYSSIRYTKVSNQIEILALKIYTASCSTTSLFPKKHKSKWSIKSRSRMNFRIKSSLIFLIMLLRGNNQGHLRMQNEYKSEVNTMLVVFTFPRITSALKGHLVDGIDTIQAALTTALNKISFEEFQGSYTAQQNRCRKCFCTRRVLQIYLNICIWIFNTFWFSKKFELLYEHTMYLTFDTKSYTFVFLSYLCWSSETKH